VTLALFKENCVDITISGGLATLAELLRLDSSCPVMSTGFGVRKVESHRFRVGVKFAAAVDREIMLFFSSSTILSFLGIGLGLV